MNSTDLFVNFAILIVVATRENSLLELLQIRRIIVLGREIQSDKDINNNDEQ